MTDLSDIENAEQSLDVNETRLKWGERTILSLKLSALLFFGFSWWKIIEPFFVTDDFMGLLVVSSLAIFLVLPTIFAVGLILYVISHSILSQWEALKKERTKRHLQEALSKVTDDPKEAREHLINSIKSGGLKYYLSSEERSALKKLHREGELGEMNRSDLVPILGGLSKSIERGDGNPVVAHASKCDNSRLEVADLLNIYGRKIKGEIQLDMDTARKYLVTWTISFVFTMSVLYLTYTIANIFGWKNISKVPPFNMFAFVMTLSTSFVFKTLSD